MYTHDFCILCLTETWLSDYVSDGEILPYGYVIYRKDRFSRGGGVLVAIKESLYSCIISSPSDLEIVTVKIGQRNDSVISCVYVPPDSPLSYVSSLVTFFRISALFPIKMLYHLL